jgi:DNA-binding NarL/FixJ family response regulator
MSEDGPTKRVQAAGSGSGGRRRTVVGVGDGGDTGNPKEFPGGSGMPSFEFVPRLVICDQNVLLQAGYTAMLSSFAKVIGHPQDANECLRLVNALKPDLLIARMDLDGLGGIELCTRVRTEIPETRVLFIADRYYATRHYHQAMRSGANGIFLMRHGRDEFTSAVIQVLRGGNYQSSELNSLIFQTPESFKSSDVNFSSSEIAVLLRLDLRNRGIADELEMNLKTTEKHVSSILKKLRVETRTMAALKAIRMGFVLLPVMPARDSVTGVSEDQAMAEAHANAALNRNQ